MDAPAGAERRLRSFVRREGRITPAQRRALETLLPRYGVPALAPLDPQRLYGRRAPWVLEIGFGDGESLLAQAAAHPDRDFLGIEVHRPGVGHLLLRLAQAGLENVRVVVADAVEVVREALPPASLAQVSVFFPDPWPKKRHHKRRLLQASFLALLAERLAPGGVLHLATDWPDYADFAAEQAAAVPALAPAPVEAALPRPETKFERRGRRLGHPVIDRVWRRR